MPKLPSISGKKVVKTLKKIGFESISQKGSHIKLQRIRKNGYTETVIVPNHKVVRKGTLRNGILKPINLSVQGFINLLK